MTENKEINQSMKG